MPLVVDLSRVRIGMHVILYSQEKTVARGVVEDLGGGRATARVLEAYAGQASVAKNARVEFTEAVRKAREVIPERRIRTLHLAAPEERWIGRGAFLVEDALRTASLPWADAGRLLLVRAVDLGTIPAGAAPASVALALERRLRELTPTAPSTPRIPDAPRAAAVWFRDAAEAHALLAAKLARGEEPAAWFWPLAVPAWKPGTPRSAALRALLLGGPGDARRPRGGAGAGAGSAGRRRAGSPGLCPRSGDGPWLLRACGWREPERVAALPAVRGAGALVLARWAESWGRTMRGRSGWGRCGPVGRRASEPWRRPRLRRSPHLRATALHPPTPSHRPRLPPGEGAPCLEERRPVRERRAETAKALDRQPERGSPSPGRKAVWRWGEVRRGEAPRGRPDPSPSG